MSLKHFRLAEKGRKNNIEGARSYLLVFVSQAYGIDFYRVLRQIFKVLGTNTYDTNQNQTHFLQPYNNRNKDNSYFIIELRRIIFKTS